MSQQKTTDKRAQPKSEVKSRPRRSGKRAAIKVLLLGTTVSFSSQDKSEISRILSGAVDWKYLLQLAEFHGVTSLIAYNLIQNGLSDLIPKRYLEQLNQIYNKNIFRNVLLSEELVKLLSIFNQHGVEVITLKGITLAEQLYVNFGLRTTTDIDILVPRDKTDLASSLILDMGYVESTVKRELEHPFHRVYHKNAQFPIMIELHWDLEDPKIVPFPVADLWRRAQLLQFQESTTRVLSPEDNLLYLANNLLTQDGQQLKYLYDITGILRTNQETIDWSQLIISADSQGMKPCVYYSLKWARELLGARVPESAMEALRPAIWKHWLINFLMNNKDLCTPVAWSGLRNETFILVRSLIMDRSNQSVAVFIKHRGNEKKFGWLRIGVWIILVFGAALWRNIGKFLSKYK